MTVPVVRRAAMQPNPLQSASMGKDGAHGFLALKARGWTTIAQDEATSVVYGMPKAASELGAATRVEALPDIAGAIGRAWGRLAGANGVSS